MDDGKDICVRETEPWVMAGEAKAPEGTFVIKRIKGPLFWTTLP